jgi:uncharacterized protein (TIGR00251 family)
MSHPAVQNSPEGAVLTIHVQPKASKTEYAGLHGGALKFRVAAPPVEGAANEALCAYLAGLFGLPKKAVVVLSGASSRKKRVLLAGVTADRVQAVLQI